MVRFFSWNTTVSLIFRQKGLYKKCLILIYNKHIHKIHVDYFSRYRYNNSNPNHFPASHYRNSGRYRSGILIMICLALIIWSGIPEKRKFHAFLIVIFDVSWIILKIERWEFSTGEEMKAIWCHHCVRHQCKSNLDR